ncbi:MAG TPA: peptidylprolyl isomerase [Gemmataceae bacterium]|nr:peptidylprolyl isomerase [Gemmataceae bacterium]
MGRMQPLGWAAAAFVLWRAAVQAQPPAPAAPAASSSVAARVNGQPILESALQRGLGRVPPAKLEEARKEILNHLVENALIDQYLLQLPQFTASKEEIDEKEALVRAEMKQQNLDFDKKLQEMKLTEAELRQEIAADLRWTKFCDSEATEAKLKQLFESEKVLFDGTMVRARHILLTPDMNAPKAIETAVAQLRGVKKEIEDKVEKDMAGCKATEPLAREDERRNYLDAAFAEAAGKYSQCPSKAQGGDVDFFQRSGRMVEPFSKAAFALKPFEMSDVVQTQFGVHLILLTARKEGLPNLKFEDIKDDVKDEFCDRLRDAVVAKVKPNAKIEILPPPK